jgi:ribonuclease Y
MTELAAVIGALAGIAAGYLARSRIARYRAGAAENQAKAAVEQSEQQARNILKEAEVKARAEVIRAREEFEKTTKSRRDELSAVEERLVQRETNLDRKVAMIDKKEQTIESRLQEVQQQSAKIESERAEVRNLAAEARQKLQQLAGLSEEDARKALLGRVEKELHGEVGTLIRRSQEQAKEAANREARKLVALAVQRCASSHASELMTTVVSLPSDDVKGRIIGREGRNIRALEAATGVNILIDDTPEAVVISGFDPVRREVARLALESLVADGRIHPARIEEVVARVQDGLEETIREAGASALYAIGAQDVDLELVRRVGRLKFRTSFSQNVLLHSQEVANLMGVMAGEIGLDVSLARRIGMFHDIGKALDHEVEGGHALIGADLLKRHGEDAVVVNAVAAHHEEVPAESAYAALCSAADAISSSRMGARSETSEIYLKRLEKLEGIANNFAGVKKSYAIQAGREVRLLVDPEKVDDNQAVILARDVSRKIESDLKYPGQIKIIVIRETRCVEYAR